jgi:hypothetical protein
MRRFNFNNEISQTDYLRELINKFKKQADSIIHVLKEKFEQHGLVISDIKDNSFTFRFWGLDFISKTEISFDKDSKTFKFGELNTYLIKDKKQLLIFSITFDSIGNIGNGSLLSDFADFYYVDFVNTLLIFANDHEVKFQLS